MSLQDGVTYVLKNARSGTAATSGKTTNPKHPASVTGWVHTAESPQQWTVEKVGAHVRLKNAQGQYLGISGEPQNGNPIIARSYKQNWNVVVNGSNYKFIYPGTNFCIDLDRGYASNDTKIHLYTSCTSLQQLWVPERVQKTSPTTASTLQVNKPYNIINIVSRTAFEIDELGRFIGYSVSAKRNGQKWILETAPQGLFFIKHRERGTYLGKKDDRLAVSREKQPWRIQPHGSSPKTFRILQTDNNSAINLEQGSSAPGTRVNLWKTRDTNNQVWEFELFQPPKPFVWGRPYLIINDQSKTTADLEYDGDGGPPYVVGNEFSVESTDQQWIFEEAPNNQVYITKSSSGTYISIDEAPDNGTKIVYTRNRQAWDLKADEKDPTKFRIFYPNTPYNITLDDGSVTPGTTIQLERFDPDSESQRWKFEALTKTQVSPGQTVLTPEKDIKLASQYYDDVFFPTSTNNFRLATLKRTLREAWFFPVRSGTSYEEPIRIDPNTLVTVSPESIKELSKQDVWVPGDWKFAFIDGSNTRGRIRFDTLEYVQRPHH